jgi:hypothetical protein
VRTLQKKTKKKGKSGSFSCAVLNLPEVMKALLSITPTLQPFYMCIERSSARAVVSQ